MEIKKCSCGADPQIIKLYESKRYDCFVRCNVCGEETKVYVSRSGAIKAWNSGKRDK